MEIKLFTSNKFGQIRTAGCADKPLFCLADLCKILDLSNPSQVKARLKPSEVQLIDLDALNISEGRVGNSVATFVNESGLYKVIFQSRKAEAEAFTSWVTDEVLPSIRKNGGYIQSSPEETAEQIMAKAVIIAQKTIETQKRMLNTLKGQNVLLAEENKALAPKAQYTDQVLQAKDTYTHSEMAKELNFKSWKALVDACHQDGILFKQSGIYMLYSKYAGKGYMKTRTTPYQKSDGTVGTNTISVWTETGRMFLHEHFNVEMKPIEITMFDQLEL